MVKNSELESPNMTNYLNIEFNDNNEYPKFEKGLKDEITMDYIKAIDLNSQ
jgi:hypothetical protein